MIKHHSSDRRHRGDVVPRGPESERFAAALSYAWILCLYPLLFKRKSSFIRFHAKQGLALFVLEVLSPLFLIFSWVIILVCIVASVWGAYYALNGKYWTLPFIGDRLKKANF